MVEKRTDLPANDMVQTFMAATEEEEAKLFKALALLDEEGLSNLAGILGRFDRKSRGELNAIERLLARRVLIRLHKPSTEGLATLNRILDYLDLNTNAIIEDDELELAIEVLEIFAHAESDNNSLSTRELQMLYAVLRYIDSDDSMALERGEREQLREALNEPGNFLAEQKRTNPLLKAMLD